MAQESDEPLIIHAVERALRVLQVFGPDHPAMPLTEIAKAVGLSRATTRRILMTFEYLGFMRREGRLFSPTPRVLQLGYAYISSLPFWERAQPHIRELSDVLEESSSIAVFDSPDIVYVVRVPSLRPLSLSLTIGSRLPAYATSMGLVLLSGLTPAELDSYLEDVVLEKLSPNTITDKDKLRSVISEARTNGFAISNGGRELGVLSVAAPIVDRKGHVIAALNVSTNAARITMDDLRERILPRVMATANVISDELAYI